MENNITKGIMVSGLSYVLIILLESLMKIFSLNSSIVNVYTIIIYTALLIIKPVLLLILIYFSCKALSIILKACSIFIEQNK